MTKSLLNITDLYASAEDKTILQNLNLNINQGETHILMGPNGAGKSTLLKLLTGLERPESGSITGVPERLGYVFQEDRLCGVFSAVANVRLATGRTLPEPEILRHLEELGLAGSARLPVSQLSGGMRRRVAIARAVCAGPQLLLLDEAFKALIVQGLQGPGRSVPPGHRGLYPPPYARGVPAVRHPRPGGGRPAGGPLSGPVHPMIAIWNRKNVSHSETFR